jgi:hypothetical protein
VIPVRALLLFLALSASAVAGEPGRGEALGYTAAIDGEILHVNTLELAWFKLSDVVSRPVLVNRVMTFNDCHASAYGGTVTGSVAVDYDRNTHHCRLDLAQVDLTALLIDLGVDADNISGKVSGHLDLLIPAGNPDQLSGRGTLAIKDGNLVELSFLTNLLVGDVTNTRGQDTAEASFEVANGTVSITNANVGLPRGRLLLSGTVKLDGTLRLLVIPRVSGGLLGELWLVGRWFGSALAFASSRVARAVVHGHISKPVVVLNPFAE